jgi:hypothetical protein
MIAQALMGLADEPRFVRTGGPKIEAGPEPPDERPGNVASLRHWRLAGPR